MSIFEETQSVQAPSMVSLLLSPRMLVSLFVVWILFVLVGSGVSFFVAQHNILSGFDAQRLLSASQQLAETNNIDYTPTAVQQIQKQQTTQQSAIYPTRLVIPRIGTNLPVSNPQTRNIAKLDEALKSSAVRYPDSAPLGVQGGNTLLFGHSSRLPIVHNKFYKAFNNIEKLPQGAIIKVYAGNDIYTYSVTRVYKASAVDAKIPLTVAGSRLTLLTCNSFGKKSDRWVVEANLVGKNI